MRWLLPLFAIFVFQPCNAQTAVERGVAHKAIVGFLDSIHSSTKPAELLWITGKADRGKDLYARPPFTEATPVESSLFDTDVAEVRGFKEVFEMKIITTQGTRDSKFLVIAFRDAATDQWKILSALQDVDETVLDMERQVGYYKDKLDDTDTSSERENYTTYGLWLLRSGHIAEARNALTKAKTAEATSALEDAVKEGPDRVRDLQIEALLGAIQKIAPGLH